MKAPYLHSENSISSWKSSRLTTNSLLRKDTVREEEEVGVTTRVHLFEEMKQKMYNLSCSMQNLTDTSNGWHTITPKT